MEKVFDRINLYDIYCFLIPGMIFTAELCILFDKLMNSVGFTLNAFASIAIFIVISYVMGIFLANCAEYYSTFIKKVSKCFFKKNKEENGYSEAINNLIKEVIKLLKDKSSSEKTDDILIEEIKKIIKDNTSLDTSINGSIKKIVELVKDASFLKKMDVILIEDIKNLLKKEFTLDNPFNALIKNNIKLLKDEFSLTNLDDDDYNEVLYLILQNHPLKIRQSDYNVQKSLNRNMSFVCVLSAFMAILYYCNQIFIPNMQGLLIIIAIFIFAAIIYFNKYRKLSQQMKVNCNIWIRQIQLEKKENNNKSGGGK